MQVCLCMSGESIHVTHCLNCFKQKCSNVHCRITECENGCGYLMHHCKIREHSEICIFRYIDCPNSSYGCPTTMIFKDFKHHLLNCPANVIICPFFGIVKEAVMSNCNSVSQANISDMVYKYFMPPWKSSSEKTVSQFNPKKKVCSKCARLNIKCMYQEEIIPFWQYSRISKTASGSKSDIPTSARFDEAGSGIPFQNSQGIFACQKLLKVSEFEDHYINYHLREYHFLFENGCWYSHHYGCEKLIPRFHLDVNRMGGRYGKYFYNEDISAISYQSLECPTETHDCNWFLDLCPVEVWEEIFKNLDSIDLYQLSRTCTDFRNLVCNFLATRGAVFFDYERVQPGCWIHKHKKWIFTTEFKAPSLIFNENFFVERDKHSFEHQLETESITISESSKNCYQKCLKQLQIYFDKK